MKLKKILIVLGLLMISFLLNACRDIEDVGAVVDGYTNIGDIDLEQVQLPEVGEEIVVVNTNKGRFKIRLFDEIAPNTVGFVKELVNESFYDGFLFSRIEEDYLIQVEIPEEDETPPVEHFGEYHNDYRHFNGALGLAQTEDGFTGGSFYIISNGGIEEDYLEAMEEVNELYPEDIIDVYSKLGGSPKLDMQFTVFGQVFYGMDIVMEINKIPVDEISGEPTEAVIIEKMELEIFEGQE